MQNKLSFTRHIWNHYLYVMSANVLSHEPTREADSSSLSAEVSSGDLCYLKLIRSFHDGTYLASVSAFPESLRSRSYTVVVNDTRLVKARPWQGQLAKSALYRFNVVPNQPLQGVFTR